MKEVKSKYKAGENISFLLNGIIKSNNSKVLSIVNFDFPIFGIKESEPIYIIEHEKGFTPNAERVERYKLDAKKKYLFIKESQIN